MSKAIEVSSRKLQECW